MSKLHWGVCAILMILTLNRYGAAAEWFVDSEAVGNGSGRSWGNAWPRFDAIVWSAVEPGDTVYISGGSTSKLYGETLNVGRDGLPDRPISIRPGVEGGHNGRVVIDAEGVRMYGVVLRSYIMISGCAESRNHLEVRNATRACVYGSRINGSVLSLLDISGSLVDGVHFVWPSDHTTIRDSIIRNNARDGYRCPGSAPTDRKTRIYRCVLVNNANDAIMFDSGHEVFACYIAETVGGINSDGIEANGYDNLIYNNVIVNVAGVGVINKASPNYTNVHSIVIANNLILQRKEYDHLVMRGIAVTSASNAVVTDVLVANNTVVDCRSLGVIVTLGETEQVEIVNNVLHNVSWLTFNYGVRVSNAGGLLTFDYNHFSAGGSGRSSVQWNRQVYSQQELASMGVAQMHGVTSTPDFLNYRELANEKEELYLLTNGTFGISLELWAERMSLPALCNDIDGFRSTVMGGWTVGALALPAAPLEAAWSEMREWPRFRAYVRDQGSYSISSTYDLLEWSPLVSGEATGAKVIVFEDPRALDSPGTFYRIVR